MNTVELFYSSVTSSSCSSIQSLIVPFFLPEQHIELSPGQTCKTNSLKDAQDPNSLKGEYLHDLPLPKMLEILILCARHVTGINLREYLTNAQISLLIISYTRASGISQAARHASLVDFFHYRLLEARLSSLFPARLCSPSLLNPRPFPTTTLRPLPAGPRVATTAARARRRVRRGGEEAAAAP